VLTNAACDQIAGEVQAQLLTYRLQHFKKMCDDQNSGLWSHNRFPALPACVQGDEEFRNRVHTIVNNAEQEARNDRGRKPEVAVVEVLWAPSHGMKDLRVKEITKWVNTLIRTRGEILEYSEIEVGNILANY